MALKKYMIVVLIFIFLVTNDAMHLFMYLMTISISLMKFLYNIFPPFFNWAVFLYLNYKYKYSLYTCFSFFHLRAKF